MLEKLEKHIAKRADSGRIEESWTATLLAKGVDKCAEKFGEEAVETIIAAVKGDKQALREESADMLYHFLVMLKAAGVTIAEIETVLKTREGQSGIAEKASRKKS